MHTVLPIWYILMLVRPLLTCSWQGKLLTDGVQAAPAAQLSFYPGDASRLCSIGSDGAWLWSLERLLSSYQLGAKQLQLQQCATAHAWAPEVRGKVESRVWVACTAHCNSGRLTPLYSISIASAQSVTRAESISMPLAAGPVHWLWGWLNCVL